MSILLTNSYFGGNNKKLIDQLPLPLPRELAIYAAALSNAGIRNVLYDTMLVDFEAFKQYLFTQRYERICLFINKGTTDNATALIQYVREEEELRNTSFVVMGPGALGYENELFDLGVSVIVYDINIQSFVSLIQILQTPFNPFLDHAKGIKFRNILGNIVTQPADEPLQRDFSPDYQGISVKRYVKQSGKYIIPFVDDTSTISTSLEEAVVEKQYIERSYGWNVWLFISNLNMFLTKLSFLPASHADLFDRIIINIDSTPDLSPLLATGCSELAISCSAHHFIKLIEEKNYIQTLFVHITEEGIRLQFMLIVAYELPNSVQKKLLYDFCKAYPQVHVQLTPAQHWMEEWWSYSNRKEWKKHLHTALKLDKMNQYMQTIQLLAAEQSRWKWLKPSYYLTNVRAFYQSLTNG